LTTYLKQRRRASYAAGLSLAILTMMVPHSLSGQTERDRSWVFTTRLVATGSSDHSNPPGFKVYSAFTLEAGLRRAIGRSFAAELTIRTESREVDSLVTAGEDARLGSLELLPLDLFLQYRLRLRGNLHPYAGAGLNLTVAWEKSGVLDSTDMAGSLGPALQIGTDIDLSSDALLNIDLKWNSFTANLSNAGTRFASLQIDPLSLGVGVGFRF
jgi:outer membrane protein